jgi:hypothetical protein
MATDGTGCDRSTELDSSMRLDYRGELSQQQQKGRDEDEDEEFRQSLSGGNGRYDHRDGTNYGIEGRTH